MNIPYSYVSFDITEKESDIDMKWWTGEIPVNQKKIELEKKEQEEAIKYQKKLGFLPTFLLEIEATEKIKLYCTPPIITVFKGVDLFKECPCGSGQLIIDCCLSKKK